MADIDTVYTCPIQSGTDSVPSRVGHYRKFRYGRVPEEILIDSRVSNRACRLYAIMAMYVYEGNVVTLGMRKMADMLNTSRSTTQRALENLIECGHITAKRGVKGERSFYQLTSPVFAQKQGKVNIVRSGPRGSRLVSVEKVAGA